MQLFIKVNGRNFLYDYNVGDNIDKYIVYSFIDTYNTKNFNICNYVNEYSNDFLKKSLFKLKKNYIRFGEGYKLQENDDCYTLNHHYIGGTEYNFTPERVEYFKHLVNYLF